MTIMAVQCRLSSTRLPGKGILPLGDKTVLDWVLSSMKKVPADEYYVATDKESAPELKGIARKNGFKIFEGPLDDVLERYCLLIEKTKADIVIRATGDNPFLFYEAAESLLEQFKYRNETSECDYITFTGLPHGSGVEIFSGKSLLKARDNTENAYDHEHVGPALYNHTDKFECITVLAPSQWNYPKLRTTIDTMADYKRAVSVVRNLGEYKMPLPAEKIIEAFSDDSVIRAVLCVPCVKKGKGTGHLRRCLSVAVSIGADVLIPEDADLEELDELLSEAKQNGLIESQIVRKIPAKDEYSLILTDAFAMERDFAIKLADAAPVVAVDEGSLNTDLCDYLLDIIPSYGLQRPSNLADPSFVTLPKNRRTLPRLKSKEEIKEILVTVGGEDPADLVIPAATEFLSLGYKVTAIVHDIDASKERIPENLREKIVFMNAVHNLRDRLYQYDLVVTHYGFTAFEALAAGCAVILLGTSPLHIQLAKEYGFVFIDSSEITKENVENSLCDMDALYPKNPVNSSPEKEHDLGNFIRKLSAGQRLFCPVCTSEHPPFTDAIAARTAERTFRRCHTCGMLYMAWTNDSESMEYDEKYFFDSYKKQYGKTYLEDFSNIKAQCVRRTSVIDFLYRNSHRVVTPTVLDIGCAYGAYLDAANDAGWQVFGTDIFPDAVSYVQEKLHFPASCSKFPAFDPASEFGISEFDAVTMWYVIEHFKNLDGVLKNVSQMLKKGGIFAFSTPSASGVSARFNSRKFFKTSPADHYSLWEPSRAASILKKYGFKVVKIISTGHHPERFPVVEQKKIRQNSIRYAFYTASSHFFGLGDTFEVYCKKERDI